MRNVVVAALYAFALALIWQGCQTAPQIGWPRTDLEVHGCALLVLGIIAKGLAHWQMLVPTHR